MGDGGEIRRVGFVYGGVGKMGDVGEIGRVGYVYGIWGLEGVC